jgi:hypothetical protein
MQSGAQKFGNLRYYIFNINHGKTSLTLLLG